MRLRPDCPASRTFRAGPAWSRPAGTPRQIVDKIQGAVVKMYADPAIYKKLEGSGITAVSSTPEDFEAYFRKEVVRWDAAFKESGIRLD